VNTITHIKTIILVAGVTAITRHTAKQLANDIVDIIMVVMRQIL